jgi:hypothetical protein
MYKGTTFCGTIGRNGINGDISPNFACVHDKENKIPGYDNEYNNKYLFDIKPPWTFDEMNIYINKARQYFHMISWEFNSIDDIDTITRPLHKTNWEHSKLLSIVITRDPISRLLAGNAMTKRKYIGYNTGNMLRDRWWDYIAKDYNKNTDNFFIRMIGNYPRNTPNTQQQQQIQIQIQIQNKHNIIRNNNYGNNNNNNSNSNISNGNNDNDNNENSNNNNNNNRIRNRDRKLSRKKDKGIGKLKRGDIKILEKEMAFKKQNEEKDVFGGSVSKSKSKYSVTDMLKLYPSYITKDDYDFAVQQLNRYTIVLDIECLNDGIIELSKLLGLNTTNIISILNDKKQPPSKNNNNNNNDTNSTTTTTTNANNKGKHLTTRQRIGYDDVYQYLIEKNYWDIKLYEYSKNISLVRC